MAKKVENRINGFLHKLNCKCLACKSKRGETVKKNNLNYKHGKYSKDYKNYCLICKKEISSISKHCCNCAGKLHSIKILGENNGRWLGGISKNSYPLGWNKIFKEQVRFRDNYKCKICDKPEIENMRKLDVHHIDYNRDNLNWGNLITLCRSCHMKTNTNREYWINYFTGGDINGNL